MTTLIPTNCWKTARAMPMTITFAPNESILADVNVNDSLISPLISFAPRLAVDHGQNRDTRAVSRLFIISHRGDSGMKNRSPKKSRAGTVSETAEHPRHPTVLIQESLPCNEMA